MPEDQTLRTAAPAVPRQPGEGRAPTLADSGPEFRLLVETIGDYGISMLDPDGIVMSWNLGAERTKGYRAEEIVGLSFERFYTAQDRLVGVPQRALLLARTVGRFEDEGWRVRKDGTRFWASVAITPIVDRGRLVGFAEVTKDVSDRRKAQLALAESERRFRLLVASVSDYAIYMLDTEGLVTNWNLGAQRLTGYVEEEVLGRNVEHFYLPEERKAGVPAKALTAAAERGRYVTEGWRVRKDSTRFWASVVVDRIRDEDGQHIGFAKVTRDISERRENDKRLHRLAHVDGLTGLANRLSIISSLESAIGRGPVALLLVDLDGFKGVNDTLGHAAGDAVLHAAAERIQGVAGSAAAVGRLGGDEFAIVLDGVADAGVAAAASERLMRSFQQPFVVQEQDLILGASIGIALAPEHGRSAVDLLTSADLALYASKADSRRGFSVFQPRMRMAAMAKLAHERDVHHAVQKGEFEVFFQPQVRLSDKVPIAAESVLRWRHPRKGIISPAGFLDALERPPLAIEVGDWVVQQACAHAAKVRALGRTDYTVGVNLFGAQLLRPDLVPKIVEELSRYDLPGEALEVEITEKIILQQSQSIASPLKKLRELGVKIAFDDYGTGYASLSILKQFPLTRLKIDRSFVSDLCVDPGDEAVVKAIIYLAESFGLDVLAEGIETEEQAAFLQRVGCEKGQGYLYGRPMPEPELLRQLAQGGSR